MIPQNLFVFSSMFARSQLRRSPKLTFLKPNPSFMKTWPFLFLLCLACFSCASDIIEPTPIITESSAKIIESPQLFSQYRGYVDFWDTDTSEIKIGHTNSEVFDTLVLVDWEYDGYIVFESTVLEFEADESEIHGTEACEEYGALGDLGIEGGVNRLRFEPAAEFWDCLELAQCDLGDEVFVFDVFVRFGD